MRRCALLLGTLSAASAFSAAFGSELPRETSQASAIPVRFSYNTSDPVYLRRAEYVAELLELVLSKSGAAYKLEIQTVKTTPSVRTTEAMNRGRYDIAAVHTNSELEANLIPIRIPIFRGLTGWRLLFIDMDDEALFAAIKAEDQLRVLTAGQGHNWPDNPVFMHNRYTLRTALNRDSLFNLILHKRIDYFPRGLYQIWTEQELLSPESVVIENSILLRYPTATYLFVSKEHQPLAAALEKGFEAAIADGSFKQFFFEKMGVYILRGKLDKRIVFDLENPNLPPQTPLQRKELWFSLDELKEDLWAR